MEEPHHKEASREDDNSQGRHYPIYILSCSPGKYEETAWRQSGSKDAWQESMLRNTNPVLGGVWLENKPQEKYIGRTTDSASDDQGDEDNTLKAN